MTELTFDETLIYHGPKDVRYRTGLTFDETLIYHGSKDARSLASWGMTFYFFCLGHEPRVFSERLGYRHPILGSATRSGRISFPDDVIHRSDTNVSDRHNHKHTGELLDSPIHSSIAFLLFLCKNTNGRSLSKTWCKIFK